MSEPKIFVIMFSMVLLFVGYNSQSLKSSASAETDVYLEATDSKKLGEYCSILLRYQVNSRTELSGPPVISCDGRYSMSLNEYRVVPSGFVIQQTSALISYMGNRGFQLDSSVQMRSNLDKVNQPTQDTAVDIMLHFSRK